MLSKIVTYKQDNWEKYKKTVGKVVKTVQKLKVVDVIVGVINMPKAFTKIIL